MLAKYAAVHGEAEVYLARLISGRAIPDFDLKVAAMALGLSEIVKDGRPLDGSLPPKKTSSPVFVRLSPILLPG